MIYVLFWFKFKEFKASQPLMGIWARIYQTSSEILDLGGEIFLNLLLLSD